MPRLIDIGLVSCVDTAARIVVISCTATAAGRIRAAWSGGKIKGLSFGVHFATSRVSSVWLAIPLYFDRLLVA
jgi:hypothetical protein